MTMSTNNNNKRKATSIDESEGDDDAVKIWTKRETEILLELYKENKDNFKLKKHLWQKIHEKLLEENIKATPAQCDSKLKNLNHSKKR